MMGGAENRAVLFPGQGSQEKGMGREVAEHDSEVMDLWKSAETISKAPLREIYWDGDTQAMTETRYQQPALVVVGLGLWTQLGATLKPAALAGHSVGEYAALAASGVLSLPDVLKIVALRGRLMFEAGEQQAGKMAACLKLEQAAVEEIVREAGRQTNQELCIANFNSPVQLVLSGAAPAVDLAVKMIKEKKGRAVPLPVSGAFHSAFMQEAAQELAGYMATFQWARPRIPVHMNVTGRAEQSSEAILSLMQKQMISPVRWLQLIQDQQEQGIRHWFELGPKGVLTGLFRYIFDQSADWQAEKISDWQEVINVHKTISDSDA